MTEKKPEIHSENPSTAEALTEADYNNDNLWNYFPLPKDYYEISDTWGVR